MASQTWPWVVMFSSGTSPTQIPQTTSCLMRLRLVMVSSSWNRGRQFSEAGVNLPAGTYTLNIRAYNRPKATANDPIRFLLRTSAPQVLVTARHLNP